MIKYLKLSTLVFDPAKYEKLNRTEGYEVDKAILDLNDSYEFGEIVLCEEDCWSVKRIESSYPQLNEDNKKIPMCRIYIEKDGGIIITLDNVLGTPSKLIDTIDKQLEVWHKELEKEAEAFEETWSQETFKSFIKEIITFPKKERDKYLKELNLNEVLTKEFLEELKNEKTKPSL